MHTIYTGFGKTFDTVNLSKLLSHITRFMTTFQPILPRLF